MCGISGFVSLSGENNIDQELMKTMNRKLAHRGPDAEGYFFDQGIALAHRRLSIIDVSSGHQPMLNEEQRLIIVFNGEIYNFLELNEKLIAKGYEIKTHSDTETILHAYEEWGVDCLVHLTGMFAFVIYDKVERTVFIARDRVGEKPFFFMQLGDAFYFASELKALQAHPEFDQKLNREAVEDYLTFGYIPETKSIFSCVNKLQPAHYLQFSISTQPNLVQKRYWDLPSTNANAGSNESGKDSTDILYQSFKSKVGQRMMSEVPLGAFLSGGVDSSGVVAAMAQLNPDSKVTTCSMGFDVPEFNESDFAQAVATRYKTDHHLEIIDHQDLSLIDKLTDIYDEPFADSSALPTYRVCELAKKHVTVCLSGDGGDEIFAGYRRYKLHRNEEKVRRKIPLWIRKVIFSALAKIYPKADWAPRFLRAKVTFQALAMNSWGAYLNSVSNIRKDERHDLYSDSFKSKLDSYTADTVFKNALAGRAFDDPVKEAQYLDFKTWLPSDILVKVDRASMANSLEVRVPMLDHQFLEKFFPINTDLNIKKGQGKALFKKSLEPYLPHDNLYRDKMGFRIPMSEWLRGPLKEKLENSLFHPKLIALSIFKESKLRTMFELHQSHKRDFGAELWTIFMFSLFVQKNDVIL